jgi:hypothetical protein
MSWYGIESYRMRIRQECRSPHDGNDRHGSFVLTPRGVRVPGVALGQIAQARAVGARGGVRELHDGLAVENGLAGRDGLERKDSKAAVRDCTGGHDKGALLLKRRGVIRDAIAQEREGEEYGPCPPTR